MTERLTTLTALKDWLELSEDTTTSDASLIRIIDAASQFVLSWLNIDAFAAADYVENLRGNGKAQTFLRHYPVIAVSSVGIGGTSIPAAAAGVNGSSPSGYSISDFRNQPQQIQLSGWHFGYGVTTQIAYRAGWEAAQVFTITELEGSDPQAAMSIATTAKGQWVKDEGVTSVSGQVFELVDADPGVGQYAVSEWGVYTFNAADIGKIVAIRFGYCPYDISFAVTELIGEWWARKDRIGVLSKTLGGQETVVFSDKDMNGSTRGVLQIYQNVVPM